MRRSPSRIRAAGLAILLLGLALPVNAHAPSVSREEGLSPQTAVVLEDPTLSRAIGATIGAPGEVDWYRMDLAAGDPLVVGMTAPDARGALAATFVVVGPGLPDLAESGGMVAEIARQAGMSGGLAFQPAQQPALESHAGLGFLNYGMLRTQAPVDGAYYVAVFANDPMATGKYVLAPGVREEFGLDAIGGLVDLIGFFDAPWPPPSDGAEDGQPEPSASNSG